MNEESHPYVTSDLWAAIEGALRSAGKDVTRLTSLDTAPIDHFHTGGIEASKDLLRLASGVQPSEVLDLGAGIGGASRFLAERTGASITSLDFSAEFCDVNRRLSRATGFAARVRTAVGDAVALPFRPGRFDLVWMQQAGMNISDKERLWSEVVRVLRPGGRFAFQEIVAGPEPGPLELPVAWAASQDDSHLEAATTMRSRLLDLGMQELAFEDVTAVLLPGLRERVNNVQRSGPPALSSNLLSTSDLLPILQGMLASALAGRIGFVRGVFSAS